MATASHPSPSFTCPLLSLISESIQEPLPGPVEAMSDSELQNLNSNWSAKLLACIDRLALMLKPSEGGESSGAKRPSATLIKLHLFSTGCQLTEAAWSKPELALSAASRLCPLLPPLTAAAFNALDFQPALGASAEPGCVPFSIASMVSLLCRHPGLAYPAAEHLSQTAQRHCVSLTARLCSHHTERWQLLGLDCLAAGLLTVQDSALARELLNKLGQSREPRILHQALQLTAELRPICPPDWLLDTVYLSCLQCLSYECRAPLQLARLAALPSIIRRLGIASIKYGSLLVTCIDNCLSRCSADMANCVWLVLDAYLQFCLYERPRLAQVLINFALHNPKLDCRHLPAIEPGFVNEVCSRLIAELPETEAALARYIT